MTGLLINAIVLQLIGADWGHVIVGKGGESWFDGLGTFVTGHRRECILKLLEPTNDTKYELNNRHFIHFFEGYGSIIDLSIDYFLDVIKFLYKVCLLFTRCNLVLLENIRKIEDSSSRLQQSHSIFLILTLQKVRDKLMACRKLLLLQINIVNDFFGILAVKVSNLIFFVILNFIDWFRRDRVCLF